MLIDPSAVRLLRIENTISNLILFRVVEINIARANSQRSTENIDRNFIVFFFQSHFNRNQWNRLTNVHFVSVVRYHPDMLLAPDHVPISMHPNRPVLLLYISYIEFLHATDSSHTIQQFLDHAIPKCVHLCESTWKRFRFNRNDNNEKESGSHHKADLSINNMIVSLQNPQQCSRNCWIFHLKFI